MGDPLVLHLYYLAHWEGPEGVGVLGEFDNSNLVMSGKGSFSWFHSIMTFPVPVMSW